MPNPLTQAWGGGASLLLPLGTLLAACAIALTTLLSFAYRLRRDGTGASSRAVHHAATRRPAYGTLTAGNFTGIFATQASEHNRTIFDPEIELLNELAARCATELTPAWLMWALAMRYLPLIALRLLWRRAGLVSHADALPHRGRCHRFTRDLFDYGRGWSLLFVATLLVRLPLGAAAAPLVWAARTTSARTRAARRATTTSLRELASVAAWVAEPAIACDPTHADVSAALTTSAWRAIHDACFAGARATLLVANLLLYAYYTDARDAADAARQRASQQLGLSFEFATRAAKTSLPSEPPS